MLKHSSNAEKKYSQRSQPSYRSTYLKALQIRYFQIQTFEEARKVAFELAKSYPHPTIAETGLNELMMNAVEHGSLNISFDEKHKILNENNWMNTIYERLFSPDNKKKKVSIRFEKTPTCITTIVQDQGEGFDWTRFTDNQPTPDLNGHGIFLAKHYSFDDLEYIGNGNTVISRVYLRTRQ